jgi:TolA-binding protein
MFRLSTFLRELHRRSIWQALGSYAVVAWIVLQLAETLEGLIGLPLWFGRAVVAVVVAGFPVLLVTTLVESSKWKVDEGLYGAADEDSFDSWTPLEDSPFKAAFRRLFTFRNWALGGVAMVALLGLGTMGYSGVRTAGLGPWGSLQARGIFEAEEALILAEFEDHTDGGTLGETVTALFRIDLGQSPSVVLLERSRLSPALVRMQRDPKDPMTHDVALEIAQREGVKGVVMGEVLPLGPGAVVSARLVAANSGENLVALRETARTIDAIPDAVDRLSAQLRAQIGESFRTIQADPPLEEVTTASTEALRKYVQATRAADMGDLSGAKALVREAIALDSTFSMAHRKLGVLLSNEGGGPEAEEAFAKAYEGRERLTIRERLLAEAAYHTYVTEEIGAAVQAYEAVLEQYPNDRIAGNNLAVLYGENGRQARALELYRSAIDRGDAPAVSYGNAVFALYELGQVDSARAMLDTFQAAYPESPATLQYAAAWASAQFDYREAEAHVRELLTTQAESPRWQMLGEAEMASYALIRGRFDEARERVLRAYDLQDEAGTRFYEGSRAELEAIVAATVRLHYLEDPEGAVSALEDFLRTPEVEEVSAEQRNFAELAGLLAAAGRTDLARQQLRAYQTEMPPDAQAEAEYQSRFLLAEAAISLQENNSREALRLLQEARGRVPECKLCFLVEMGEAFEAASMPDSAAAAYEAYLDADVLFRSEFDNARLHRALLGLSRSHEALNQPDRATEYYTRVLALWSNSDPALRSRVEGIRARIAALDPE